MIICSLDICWTIRFVFTIRSLYSKEAIPSVIDFLPWSNTVKMVAFNLYFFEVISFPSLSVLCLCLVAESCLTLCNHMDCSPPGSSAHGVSPGKNTGVGRHGLLQGVFPTQGSSSGLPHCRLIYHLSHQGSPPSLSILGEFQCCFK